MQDAGLGGDPVDGGAGGETVRGVGARHVTEARRGVEQPLERLGPGPGTHPDRPVDLRVDLPGAVVLPLRQRGRVLRDQPGDTGLVRLAERLLLLGAVRRRDTRLQILLGGVDEPGVVGDGLDLQRVLAVRERARQGHALDDVGVLEDLVAVGDQAARCGRGVPELGGACRAVGHAPPGER